jgi:hypothetical protein
MNCWTTAARHVRLGTKRDHSFILITRHVQNTVREPTVVNMTKKWNSKVIFDKGNIYVDSSNKLETSALWNAMPCISVKANRPFRATYCHQIQGWEVLHESNKHFSLSACYMLVSCVHTCIVMISANADPHSRNQRQLTTEWILLTSDMWCLIIWYTDFLFYFLSPPSISFAHNCALTVSPCCCFIYNSTHYTLRTSL